MTKEEKRQKLVEIFGNMHDKATMLAAACLAYRLAFEDPCQVAKMPASSFDGLLIDTADPGGLEEHLDGLKSDLVASLDLRDIKST